MHASSLHYFPVTWPFLLILAVLLGAVAGVVAARMINYAASDMGIGPRTILALLLFSLLGSYINIPVAYLPDQAMQTVAEFTYFGVTYIVPVTREWPATMLAINVGGAVIPILLSLYLVRTKRLYGASLIGITVVAMVCHFLARPIPGLGIVEPVFAPPLIAALVSLLLSRRHAAPLAYITGSLGTLIGADLLNLDKLQGLGAPILSIGGAGTFDGIFVTGLVAVLYASLVTHRTIRQ